MKKLLAILLTISVLICFGLFAMASGTTSKTGSTTASESSTTSEETTTEATTTTTTTAATEEDSDEDDEDDDEDDEDDGEIDVSLVDPELKAFLDSYEAYMDEYIDFMKKMADDPNDITVITEYADMMKKYAEFAQAVEAYDTDEMSEIDSLYYIEVMTRVSAKLMEAGVTISNEG